MADAVAPADAVPPRTSPPRASRVLQTDVAVAAGVSYQTVSRVLHRHPSVRPETRERVLEAIRRLGYSPDRNARALATGRTSTIGVIIFNATQFGPASILDAISSAARRSGFMVFTVVAKTSATTELEDIIEQMTGHAVQGLITIAPTKDLGRTITLLSQGLPMVTLDGSLDDRTTVVTVDEAAGAALATRHLLGLGHPTVWHISGPRDSIAAEGRVTGWRAELRAAGVRPPQPLVGRWDAASGYAMGRKVAGRPDVTAVFTGNDQMAVGLLRALHEAGRRVPDDVSVVGFDDVPESAYLIPSLTTLRVDFAEMGRRCVDLLIAQIADQPATGIRSVVPAELIERGSTGPYREPSLR